ncbi:hypothetical protein EGR_07329 [Echinococcus granulosus]|uniref:Uncharacterized protein n=1 Tax=Echinococcus granulosus TaxID=6210 RepID=W6U8Z4_ECHGR|nr:hypothetical protein EGR_07329 [Echinococcus granulosus]EUB57858.1 hypothetical protein EGR_07329 [Echinococcus granulosus]
MIGSILLADPLEASPVAVIGGQICQVEIDGCLLLYALIGTPCSRIAPEDELRRQEYAKPLKLFMFDTEVADFDQFEPVVKPKEFLEKTAPTEGNGEKSNKVDVFSMDFDKMIILLCHIKKIYSQVLIYWLHFYTLPPRFNATKILFIETSLLDAAFQLPYYLIPVLLQSDVILHVRSKPNLFLGLVLDLGKPDLLLNVSQDGLIYS